MFKNHWKVSFYKIASEASYVYLFYKIQLFIYI